MLAAPSRLIPSPRSLWQAPLAQVLEAWRFRKASQGQAAENPN